MGEQTLERFLAAKGVEVMAELYPDDGLATMLLGSCGADLTRLPRFTNARLFWHDVVHLIGNGAFTFGLGGLVDAARADWPSSGRLRRLGVAITLVEMQARPPDEALDRQPDDGQQQPPLTRELGMLLLMAAPTDANRLRLDAEHREIVRILERRRVREVRLTAHPATQVADLIDQIASTRPDVLHFTGHGSPKGRLIFEDSTGRAKAVSAQSLSDILQHTVGTLDCVVLGSCYGAVQVRTLLAAAHSVIGAVKAISDAAAMSFTRGFYTGLVNGAGPLQAFKLGTTQMELDGHPTGEMRYLDRDGAAEPPADPSLTAGS